MMIPEQSWGFSASVIYEAKREMTAVTATLNGVSSTATYNNKPSIQIGLIEGSAIYRWDRVYVPFGLNYSIPTFKDVSGSTVTTAVKGAVGGQLGVGVFVNDNFHVTVISRAMAVQISASSGSTTVNYKTGYLPGIALQTNYLF